MAMRCPSCGIPLDAERFGAVEIVNRCGQCDGDYVEVGALQRLLSAHAAPASARAGYVPPSPFLDPVRYKNCPGCGEQMQRRNFHESSRVIVDVCARHGVWFDRGELAKILEFARTGALAEADRRNAEREATKKRIDAIDKDFDAVLPRRMPGRLG
jgi:Zn-finger nucleic acid-binding protein